MSEPGKRMGDREHGIPLTDASHPETMYDHSDLSARGILYFLIVLAIAVIAVHLLMWGALRFFDRQQLTPVPRNAAIVTPSWQVSPKGDPVQRFPAPQLQPDPVADLNKFRASVEQQLNSVSDGKIPIEQAIDQVAKGGLQVRPEPNLAPRTEFGSGADTAPGSGGGTQPMGRQ